MSPSNAMYSSAATVAGLVAERSQRPCHFRRRSSPAVLGEINSIVEPRPHVARNHSTIWAKPCGS